MGAEGFHIGIWPLGPPEAAEAHGPCLEAETVDHKVYIRANGRATLVRCLGSILT